MRFVCHLAHESVDVLFLHQAQEFVAALQIGSIIPAEWDDEHIVNTGATIGKSAIASSHLTEKTLLQKSVALIKVNSDIIIAEFLRYCYMVNPSMYMVKSASAQPNLLLSKMNSTIVYLPPIDLQRQFASFVEEIDKSRSRIQKSLEASQELFDSLMQEYFG